MRSRLERDSSMQGRGSAERRGSVLPRRGPAWAAQGRIGPGPLCKISSGFFHCQRKKMIKTGEMHFRFSFSHFRRSPRRPYAREAWPLAEAALRSGSLAPGTGTAAVFRVSQGAARRSPPLLPASGEPLSPPGEPPTAPERRSRLGERRKCESEKRKCISPVVCRSRST